MSRQPPAHPHRAALHNELHARPPEAMQAPLAISHLVMLGDEAQREASRSHLARLLGDHHLPPPDSRTAHIRMDLGSYRIRWELHTEFVTWTFSRSFAVGSGEREPATALDLVRSEWFGAIPGQMLGALHLWVLPSNENGRERFLQGLLCEQALVGSRIADGQAELLTDFALHADGFSRQVLWVGNLQERELGRVVQQLLEIDTYRMAALLGLPAAREASDLLGLAERELADLARAIRLAGHHEEPRLLDRLTKLASQVESHYATTHSRFSASAAYFELVDRRVAEIGESPLPGLQTIGEFINRRLSPARATCAWSVRRQDALSQRVSRISNLLRTRVEIEQQQSSQELLCAMNRRQGMQLKLQSTVEGLSVAAITYYIVGLVSYVAKGAVGWGWPVGAEATAAAAIPGVAAAVWWSIRRSHRRVLGA